MIYINEKLRIRKTDDYNLQLEEYRKGINPKTKEETYSWKWVGYYGDLKSALSGVLKKQLFDTADEEILLKDLVAKIDVAQQNIMNGVNDGEK